MADGPAIHSGDGERKMTYRQASAFVQALKQIYYDLGYDLIVVPQASASERAGFIQSKAASFS